MIAMMLDTDMHWCDRIPFINLVFFCFFDGTRTFDQMLAEQDQYGLMFALLLAIPMSFITAVDYDEFEEAMYRFEEGGVFACIPRSMFMGADDIVGSFSYCMTLAACFLMTGVISVIFLELILKAAQSHATNRFGDSPRGTTSPKINQWIKPVCFFQLGLLVAGLLYSIFLVMYMCWIKFPDSFYSDQCAEAEDGGEVLLTFSINSPIGFIANGKEAIVLAAVFVMIGWGVGLAYEYKREYVDRDILEHEEEGEKIKNNMVAVRNHLTGGAAHDASSGQHLWLAQPNSQQGPIITDVGKRGKPYQV
eukprot:CAMPEP_0194558764 /NCGR_PEP_ID=MMETSP0292-20121207/559_1 /TAXON_ID=39354 /ORGANISM="Heterosigma akashiwo, Strain CCMP2393" /LENGTH=305 /DNA_ID=CAMNT_0039406499 /DNA_START=210 /DNA_END=1127 /DNA_ORIENTATION=-